jgi:ABC-2 type transport system permease protein
MTKQSAVEQWRHRIRAGGRITAVNLRGQADFRADFIASILDGALWQTSVIVFASVLLTRFPSIGDWSSPAVLLLAAMRMTSHGLVTLFFGRILYIHAIVQEGHIDGYLTRPMSVYRQIQYARFSANAFGDLLVAVSMLIFAIAWFDQAWTPVRVLLLIAGIVGGAFLEAAITNVFAGLTLISPSAASWSFRFQEILSAVGNYPLNILPVGVQIALTYLVPIAFIAYLPAAAITGQLATTVVPAWLAYAAPIVGAAAYAVSRWIWVRCLDNYQGANE